MARSEIRLYVCEDSRWEMAERYAISNEEKALRDAKLSMRASGVAAVLVAQCFPDPRDGMPSYAELLSIEKPGVEVPPLPALGRAVGLRPAAPAAAAPAAKAAANGNRPKAPVPRGSAAALPPPGARPPAPRALSGPHPIAAPPPSAPPATNAATRLQEPEVGTFGQLFSALSSLFFRKPGAASEDAPPLQAAAGPNAAASIPAAPLAVAEADATRSSASRPQAGGEASPLLREARAKMLQFLQACLAAPVVRKYLPSGQLDPKNRFGFHLIMLGAGQHCITALPEAGGLPLADIAEPVLCLLGSDAGKARSFAAGVEQYRSEPKGGEMIRAGYQLMAGFLCDQSVSSTELEAALQLWNTVQREGAGGGGVEQGSDAVAIMFTDMVSSVATTQAHGDQGMMRLVEEHNLIVGAVLKTHGGHQVKHTGDGIMAVFRRVPDGLAAAAEIQRQLAQRNEASTAGQLKVRIGLSAGNPIRKDDDYFGTVVQTAARLCAVARAGEIALPDALAGFPGCETFAYEEPVAMPLKGFPEPLLVRKLVWAASGDERLSQLASAWDELAPGTLRSGAPTFRMAGAAE